MAVDVSQCSTLGIEVLRILSESTVSDNRGAVFVDVTDCSKLGVNVLRDLSGNVVDAAIPTVLCQGRFAPLHPD